MTKNTRQSSPSQRAPEQTNSQRQTFDGVEYRFSPLQPVPPSVTLAPTGNPPSQNVGPTTGMVRPATRGFPPVLQILPFPEGRSHDGVRYWCPSVAIHSGHIGLWAIYARSGGHNWEQRDMDTLFCGRLDPTLVCKCSYHTTGPVGGGGIVPYAEVKCRIAEIEGTDAKTG